MISKDNTEAIFNFIRDNKDELGRHRNIFKRALQIVLPKSLGNFIIGKTKSLTLAENYSNFIKIVSTNPTKIICRDHRDIVPLSFNEVQQMLNVPYVPSKPSAPPYDEGSNSSFPRMNFGSASFNYSGNAAFYSPQPAFNSVQGISDPPTGSIVPSSTYERH